MFLSWHLFAWFLYRKSNKWIGWKEVESKSKHKNNLNIFIWKFNPFWIARVSSVLLLSVALSLCFSFFSFYSRLLISSQQRFANDSIPIICFTSFVGCCFSSLLLFSLRNDCHFIFPFHNEIHINLKLIICGIINLFSVRNVYFFLVARICLLFLKCGRFTAHDSRVNFVRNLSLRSNLIYNFITLWFDICTKSNLNKSLINFWPVD